MSVQWKSVGTGDGVRRRARRHRSSPDSMKLRRQRRSPQQPTVGAAEAPLPMA